MPQFAANLSTMYAELGYAGTIGCEYRPRAGTSAGLAWFEPWKDSQR